MTRRWTIHRAAVVAAVLVAIGGGVATFLVVSDRSTAPSDRSTTPSDRSTTPPADVRIPAADFKPYTWGYVGCSNTRGTISGYHMAPETAHLFWPVEGYSIAGQTVPHWLDSTRPSWRLFEQMKRQHNGGSDPPVVWVQMCVNLNPEEPGYGPVTYEDVVQMLEQVRAHSPDSVVFVSPLQSYDPPTLCPKMGPDGQEIPTMMDWLDQAVDEGLGVPGPGVAGIPNLGPLTSRTTKSDRCHPSGRSGAVFLGTQLAEFFDPLPRS